MPVGPAPPDAEDEDDDASEEDEASLVLDVCADVDDAVAPPPLPPLELDPSESSPHETASASTSAAAEDERSERVFMTPRVAEARELRRGHART